MKRKPMSDEELMLKVLEACIYNEILPGTDSPCHKKLKSIIRQLRKSRAKQAKRMKIN